MPKYQVYFDTTTGQQKFNADIDDDENIEAVINDLLSELGERGLTMKGEGEGVLRVTWSDATLDLGSSLPAQGVRPNDVLRVGFVVLNG